MPRELDDPGWALVQKQIAEALAPFAPLLGGRRCTHEEDWADCDEEDCGFVDTEPRPGSMPVIQHFVLLAATYDLAQQNSRPTIVTIDAPGQAGYISRGLADDFLLG